MSCLSIDFPISRYCCDSENDSRNTIVYDSVAIVNDSLKVVVGILFLSFSITIKNFFIELPQIVVILELMNLQFCEIKLAKL